MGGVLEEETKHTCQVETRTHTEKKKKKRKILIDLVAFLHSCFKIFTFFSTPLIQSLLSLILPFMEC